MWGEGTSKMPRAAVSALAFPQLNIIEKIVTQWNSVHMLLLFQVWHAGQKLKVLPWKGEVFISFYDTFQ